MTLRELLHSIVDASDLDKELRVRIVTRDAEGAVQFVKMVSVIRFNLIIGGPSIVIEESEIELAVREKS